MTAIQIGHISATSTATEDAVEDIGNRRKHLLTIGKNVVIVNDEYGPPLWFVSEFI